ncbi:MAG: hypothetical protein JW990_07960 [Thermoleophilia bacterium]|nr:hypothetical protein [Thermoleophilia bacterium]
MASKPSKTKTAERTPEPVLPADEELQDQGAQGDVENETAPSAEMAELAGLLSDPKPTEEPEPTEEQAPEAAPDLLPAGLKPTAPEPTEEPEPEPPASAVEYVVLVGPASYGPVRIDGKPTRCLKGKPVRVRDLNERLAILGTGLFRCPAAKDLQPKPSSGPGGPVTSASLPPGAIKGGLARRGSSE